ncbi:hypothetical protein QTL86_04525 [Cellulosilyticum sp. ST5]|uniref:hypothetical protein n=1 Tax=Cellulosilyticum sp. ST5 TaxID=3055805 RepID=UPI0039775936
MKKWIITTVVLICICAGAVAYAIIAPNFNISAKAKQATMENQSYTIKQPGNYKFTITELEFQKSLKNNMDYIERSNKGAERMAQWIYTIKKSE